MLSEHERFLLFNRAESCLIDESLERMRPSVVWRPGLSIDGNQWCALYGENPQDGVAGFGESPDAAMRDFDAEWVKVFAASQKGATDHGG